jgi:hypothetical protein
VLWFVPFVTTGKKHHFSTTIRTYICIALFADLRSAVRLIVLLAALYPTSLPLCALAPGTRASASVSKSFRARSLAPAFVLLFPG